MKSVEPERERAPESHVALPENLQKPQSRRREQWKHYIYGGFFLLAAPILLHEGIYFIQMNRNVLLSVMGITNLFPFFLVGLWGFLLLTLTGLFCIALAQIVMNLNKSFKALMIYRPKRASE